MKKTIFIILSVFLFSGIAYSQESVVYVSPEGSAENEGLSPDNPMNDVQEAVYYALENDIPEVRIHGSFEAQEQHDAFIYIVEAKDFSMNGGWNEDFSAQDSETILNGMDLVYHVLLLDSCTNVTLENMTVTGGKGYVLSRMLMNPMYETGGGLYGTNVIQSTIDCTFTGNYAMYGGGLSLDASHNNIISGTMIRNEAYAGGGIFLGGSESNTISSLITENVVHYRGGGIHLAAAVSNTFTGDVIDNRSRGSGGGYSIVNSFYNEFTGAITNNTADDNGGGVLMELSDHNIFQSPILNNTADNDGGGLYLIQSHVNTFSGDISGNQGLYGGGMYVNDSQSNTFTGVISDNTAETGGGYYISLYSEKNVIDEATIENNSNTNVLVTQ